VTSEASYIMAAYAVPLILLGGLLIQTLLKEATGEKKKKNNRTLY
jgi:hypothetical protein